MEKDWHKISIKELYKRVGSNENGLYSKEAEERLKNRGPNVLEAKKKKSFILKFLSQFTNLFAVLLIIASILAFIAEYLDPGQGNIFIAVAVFAVVIINALFTFIQEYQSEKIMETFEKMLPLKARVLRDGKVMDIEASGLVLGDVILVEEGDKVPADARLIEANALKVDHSSITGESEPQLRKIECTHDRILESRNMLFSGTLVQSGDGKAIVYATGMDTEIGSIVKLTKDTRSVETPLHKEIKAFTKTISYIALICGAIFFVISLFLGIRLIGALIFAIGVIVANVPEGLLPEVTLCLTIASKRMAKKNALIKNLESVETLGATTVICTDKTGTLTQNKISVDTIYINFDQRNVFEKGLKKVSGLDILTRIMILCNNSQIEEGKIVGDPTEVALMEYSRNHVDIKKMIKSDKRMHESPFDSKTKRMITTNITKGKKYAYMKGAPEIIIKKCSAAFMDGKVRKITLKDKKDILHHYEKMASRGERVLAFAYKRTKPDKVVEKEFIFLALCGMMDPPRKEVPDAIRKCESAGIRVIMITGDHAWTAEAIARKVGIINSDDSTVITGDQLDRMRDSELRRVVKKKDLVFARSNPSHKLRIVKALQANGEVVTVTGDGVNDAPALKNADMGVAMGLNGTDVAREASDMILMDDNFATIVAAVEEGRTIFGNIKKFVAYVLISNVPELIPFLAFVILSVPLALTIILMLVIDLGTDMLPAIGLGIEKSESDVMKNPPIPRKERFLNRPLIFMAYGVHGIIESIAGFTVFFFVLFNGGWAFGQHIGITDPLYLKAVTGFFVSIVICQIANVMVSRSRHQSLFNIGIFRNKIVLVGIALEIAITAIVLYFPLANHYLGTQPLGFEMLLAVPFALSIILVDEIRKYFIRKKNPFVRKYLEW